MGRLSEAAQTCIEARPLFTGRAFLGQLLGTLGYCYGRTGKREDALRLIDELENVVAHHFVASMDLALIHAGLGDADRALDLLERANDEREFWAVAIPTEPLLRGLHRESRFVALADRIFAHER